MAEGKNKILVYRDWIHQFEKLTDDEAGQLIKHFFRYINDQNPEPPNRIIELCFEPIKQTLKRDLVKWEAFTEVQSENGKKGGRPPKAKETQKTQAFLKKPKKAVSVSVSVSDSVNDNILINNKNSGQFPKLETPCELSDLEKTLTAEFLKLTCKIDWSKIELSEMFEGFKIQNFTGQKFYESHSDIVNHFRNWMKTQKKQIVNGKSNEPGSNSRAKLAALKNW